ncbi:MAG: helix-turn-helix domain-containing protein [Clostridiales bacterium]|nr:helix-turn-helix domain-containing protein [Clostridiales bacterium]MCD8215407.1 helix-turn-helix domain-containing protein [Clostridiales bacterium]
MTKKSDIGLKVKKMRAEMGISQEELAYRCGMQPSHIGQIERGQKSPTLVTLEKLAFGFDTTVSELTDYDKSSDLSEDKTMNKIVSYLYKLNEKEKNQVLSIVKTFVEK